MEYIRTNNEDTMMAIKDIVDFVATLNTRIQMGESTTTSVFDYYPVLDENQEETGSFWFNYSDMIQHATDEGASRIETIKGLVIHGQVLRSLTGDLTAVLPQALQGIHNIEHIVTDNPTSYGFIITEEIEE
jgi:hypothetical protein